MLARSRASICVCVWGDSWFSYYFPSRTTHLYFMHLAVSICLKGMRTLCVADDAAQVRSLLERESEVPVMGTSWVVVTGHQGLLVERIRA